MKRCHREGFETQSRQSGGFGRLSRVSVLSNCPCASAQHEFSSIQHAGQCPLQAVDGQRPPVVLLVVQGCDEAVSDGFRPPHCAGRQAIWLQTDAEGGMRQSLALLFGLVGKHPPGAGEMQNVLVAAWLAFALEWQRTLSPMFCVDWSYAGALPRLPGTILNRYKPYETV